MKFPLQQQVWNATYLIKNTIFPKRIPLCIYSNMCEYSEEKKMIIWYKTICFKPLFICWQKSDIRRDDDALIVSEFTTSIRFSVGDIFTQCLNRIYVHDATRVLRWKIGKIPIIFLSHVSHRTTAILLFYFYSRDITKTKIDLNNIMKSFILNTQQIWWETNGSRVNSHLPVEVLWSLFLVDKIKVYHEVIRL